MDCKLARLLLDVAYPIATELAPAERAELARHLADCPECGSWAEAERRADEHVAKVMRDVPVPAGLDQKILQRLQVQRDVRRREWLVRAAGIAAVVLIALGLAWGFWWNKKPVPDWVAEANRVNDCPNGAAQLEDQFLLHYNVRVTAPPQFEYRYLDSYGMAEFQGRQVPRLVFFYSGAGRSSPAIAEVYVLSSRQFDLESAARNAPPGSRKSLEVVAHPDNPNVVYLVVYTQGAPREVFFAKKPPPAG
jgi:hypothetical protein